MYPEGTLTKYGDLWPSAFRSGAFLLSIRSGVSVVPIVTWGAQRLLPRYGKRWRLCIRAPLYVRVLHPVSVRPAICKEADDRLMADRLKTEVFTRMLHTLADLRSEPIPLRYTEGKSTSANGECDGAVGEM